MTTEDFAPMVNLKITAARKKIRMAVKNGELDMVWGGAMDNGGRYLPIPMYRPKSQSS